MFNICVVGMVEELERTRLGEECCVRLTYEDDIVQVTDLGWMKLQTVGVVQMYVMWWRMKFRARLWSLGRGKVECVGKLISRYGGGRRIEALGGWFDEV